MKGDQIYKTAAKKNHMVHQQNMQIKIIYGKTISGTTSSDSLIGA